MDSNLEVRRSKEKLVTQIQLLAERGPKYLNHNIAQTAKNRHTKMGGRVEER